MAVNVVLPQSVKTFYAKATNAKAELQTSANTVPAFASTDLPNGGLVKSITVIPCAGVAAATQLQLFRSKNNGTDVTIADTSVMPTHTLSANTAVPKVEFNYTSTKPMRLAPGETLHVGIGVSNTYGINFIVEIEAY